MTIRLQDIADAVGVRRSTVSRVLNNSSGTARVSQARRDQILQAARELGYHPNSSARALSTKRTGHIGFMLSDRVTDGLANMYFAQHLVGVESECRRRGYGVNVSQYNLSNIDSFVFPPKVGERSVDGLILAGYIEAAIVARFREFGVPCIAIGDNLEVGELVPTISCDVVGGIYDAVVYGASIGHERIAVAGGPSRRAREVAGELKQRVAGSSATANCRFEIIELPDARNDYSDALPLAEVLANRSANDRPTLVLATDQTLVALTSELAMRGMRCPEDISLVSVNDTVLCQYGIPPMTAVNQHVVELGKVATELLLNHLELAKPLDSSVSKNDFPCTLSIRKSCAPPRAGR